MNRILIAAAICCTIVLIGPHASSAPAVSGADPEQRLLPGEPEPPTAPNIFGVFNGRTPCQALAKMLQVSKSPDCTKAKWRLVLYCDPATREPTTYRISGLAYRDRVGKWAIRRGAAPANPTATVYQLDPDQPSGFLNFLRVDENVLYFLDREGKVMVGNAKYSYAMNRIEGVRKPAVQD